MYAQNKQYFMFKNQRENTTLFTSNEMAFVATQLNKNKVCNINSMRVYDEITSLNKYLT